MSAPSTVARVSDDSAPGYYGTSDPSSRPRGRTYIGFYFFIGRTGRRLVGPGRRRRARRPAHAGRPRPACGLSPASLPSPVLPHRRPRPAGPLRRTCCRVIKPTSPMSVGSWLLTAVRPRRDAAPPSWARRRRGPRLALMTDITAGAMGAAVATYTGALVAGHGHRRSGTGLARSCHSSSPPVRWPAPERRRRSRHPSPPAARPGRWPPGVRWSRQPWLTSWSGASVSWPAPADRAASERCGGRPRRCHSPAPAC